MGHYLRSIDMFLLKGWNVKGQDEDNNKIANGLKGELNFCGRGALTQINDIILNMLKTTVPTKITEVRISGYDRIIKELKAQVEQKDIELGKLQEEHGELEAASLAQAEELGDKTSEYSSLQTQHKASTVTHAKVLKEQNAKYNTLERKHKTQQQRVAELEKKVPELESKLQAEREALERQVEMLKTKTAKCDKLQRKNDELQAQHKEAVNYEQQKALVNDTAMLWRDQQINSKKQQVTDLEKKVNTLKAKNKAAQKKTNSLQQKLSKKTKNSGAGKRARSGRSKGLTPITIGDLQRIKDRKSSDKNQNRE